MHSYVVIVAKPGRQIDPGLLRSLDQPDHRDLAFWPGDHLLWQDRSGRVAFLGWQTATDVFELGSHWHHDERGLTAFTRHLWPKGSMWSGRETWAAQLHRRLECTRLVQAAEDLGGVFTALKVDPDGRGAVVTDPLSATVVYRSEDDDVVAYSSRASLAARATTPVGMEPARDPWSMGWLTVMGYLVGDGTGYVGTTALPAGAWVELDPRFGSRVRSQGTPWLAEVPADPDEALDLAHADLAAEVGSVARLPATKAMADITGGRDSRLILALLLEQGMTDRFTFRTHGAPDSPDRVVGEAIVEQYHLPHQVQEPVPMEADLFRRRLATHAFHTSGMLNAWDLQGGVGIARTLTVAGFYGEILRSYFHFYRPDLTRAELVDRFLIGAGLRTRQGLGGGPNPARGSTMLTPEAHRHYTAQLTDQLLWRTDNGADTSQDRLDSFYLRHRIRRWMATMEELNGPNRVHPLYSPVATRVAFALGGTARRDEVVPFEVMRRSCTALAQAAFADRGWPEGVYAARPDAASYAAAPVTAPSVESTKWQIPRLAANHEVLEEHVLEGPPDELWEVFDRGAVETAVRGPNPTGVQASQRLFGVLTAAVWLGRHEEAIRLGPKPSEDAVAPVVVRGPDVRVHRDDPLAFRSMSPAREVVTSDARLPDKARRALSGAKRRVRRMRASGPR